MRDFEETLEWYKTHETASEIGFDPDGMCLKICRTARDIGSMYPSAKAAQDATPARYRITDISQIRRGMVMYFDDAHDSNPYGHIVTVVGRVKGFDKDRLGDILVRTNGVKANEVVVVRADYFQRYWGDEFKFASNWLNGMVLDYPSLQTRVQKFRKSGPNYDMKQLRRAVTKGGRTELKPKLQRIERLVESLPDDKRTTRVKVFKNKYEKKDVLAMPLLNRAVSKGDRDEDVKRVRDRLRDVIKSLPDR